MATTVGLRVTKINDSLAQGTSVVELLDMAWANCRSRGALSPLVPHAVSELTLLISSCCTGQGSVTAEFGHPSVFRLPGKVWSHHPWRYSKDMQNLRDLV